MSEKQNPLTINSKTRVVVAFAVFGALFGGAIAFFFGGWDSAGTTAAIAAGIAATSGIVYEYENNKGKK